MKLKPLFITSPSRSGSTLLTKLLNCTANIAVVNEPINSVDIVDRDNITTIFHTIEENLKHGFITQRVDQEGMEVTDTFPPSKMKWKDLKRSSKGVRVIGIKKPFPAFSNKDFFKPFVQEWPSFVKWMIKEKKGGVVAIVRDPRFTILSWKTTFEALKESTENQCIAWNLIANTILSSQKLGVKIIRYEDLIRDPTSAIEVIANHLGVKTNFKEPLPIIKQLAIEDFIATKGISIGSAELDFMVIEKICGKTARRFGYTSMHK